MNCSLKAILARFNGDHDAAAHYCADIANCYPDLSNEYRYYLRALISVELAAAVGGGL